MDETDLVAFPPEHVGPIHRDKIRQWLHSRKTAFSKTVIRQAVSFVHLFSEKRDGFGRRSLRGEVELHLFMTFGMLLSP